MLGYGGTQIIQVTIVVTASLRRSRRAISGWMRAPADWRNQSAPSRMIPKLNVYRMSFSAGLIRINDRSKNVSSQTIILSGPDFDWDIDRSVIDPPCGLGGLRSQFVWLFEAGKDAI